jgi:2-polyprenyl-6-methoxyphenol hydroxylase-like FAD-dependent oxidoreductase
MPTLNKLLPEAIVNKLPAANCNPYLEFTEDVETVPAYNAITGDIIFKLPNPGGRRISRKRLRQVLVEGLDVRWGKQLEHIESASDTNIARLTFADGEVHEANYVFGADGVASKVRELLIGAAAARPLPSGFTIAMACPKYSDAEKAKYALSLHPVNTLYFHTSGVGVIGGWHSPFLCCLLNSDARIDLNCSYRGRRPRGPDDLDPFLV